MAIQSSGFTTNYTDPSSGMNLPQAWIQIMNILYVPYSYVLIVFNIYKDQQSYQSGMSPVFENLRQQIIEASSDWPLFFDPDTMDVSGHNIQKQSISYLEVNISKTRR